MDIRAEVLAILKEELQISTEVYEGPYRTSSWFKIELKLGNDMITSTTIPLDNREDSSGRTRLTFQG